VGRGETLLVFSGLAGVGPHAQLLRLEKSRHKHLIVEHLESGQKHLTNRFIPRAALNRADPADTPQKSQNSPRQTPPGPLSSAYTPSSPGHTPTSGRFSENWMWSGVTYTTRGGWGLAHVFSAMFFFPDRTFVVWSSIVLRRGILIQATLGLRSGCRV
jgi:hypothetical protein